MKYRREHSTILGEFLNFRQELYASLDQQILGKSMLAHTSRCKLNPMYWILGEKKVRRIDPLTYVEKF